AVASGSADGVRIDLPGSADACLDRLTKREGRRRGGCRGAAGRQQRCYQNGDEVAWHGFSLARASPSLVSPLNLSVKRNPARRAGRLRGRQYFRSTYFIADLN